MTGKDDSFDLPKHEDRSRLRTGSEMLLGNTKIAYDQGRAAAMQRFSDLECPYLEKFEPEYYAAWNEGFRSFR
jgi:hypothetical protein